jgi:aspartyl-tRNA synthetase
MVMKLIEDVLLQSILPALKPDWVKHFDQRRLSDEHTDKDDQHEQNEEVEQEKQEIQEMQDEEHLPIKRFYPERKTDFGNMDRDLPLAFKHIHYDDAMKYYGSDKPDLRIPGRIRRVEEWIPKTLRGMLTSLNRPVIEMFKISMRGTDAESSRAFVSSFMESPAAIPYVSNPHGMPGVTVFDPQRPLNGLASFGHDAAAKVEQLFQLQTGDILVVQSRPGGRNTGGSTPIGDLRVDLHHAAIEKGFLPPLIGFYPLWVTDFPLFTKENDTDDGCIGAAGLCATHHPFTAPKLQGKEGLMKLLSDPLAVRGDHFDLVINGVEVGGGSHRIHNGEMQEFILRDVLKLKPEVIESFRHLLDALKAGCPPHTGFAFGFDRLMALLTGAPTIRDVIAFPKYGDGVDHAVKAPAPITTEQLSTYHLAISESVQESEPRKISIKA